MDYIRQITHTDLTEMKLIFQYTGWQWRNFFIPVYASCSGRHDVGQRNVNILQHLQSDRRSGASIKLLLNLLFQFYLNNVTNLHQLLTSYC